VGQSSEIPYASFQTPPQEFFTSETNEAQKGRLEKTRGLIQKKANLSPTLSPLTSLGYRLEGGTRHKRKHWEGQERKGETRLTPFFLVTSSRRKKRRPGGIKNREKRPS